MDLFFSAFGEYSFYALKILQVSLLTENGNTKDDLRLPTDDNLLGQVGSLLF